MRGEMSDATKKQIMAIQGRDIIMFLLKVADKDDCDPKDIEKIQKMFNIINDNNINYGIKETNGN